MHKLQGGQKRLGSTLLKGKSRVANVVLQRLKPEYIYHDKEHLYEQAKKLKESMDGIRERNLNLKTRISQYEHNIERKNKAIHDLLDQISVGQPSVLTELSKPKHLAAALKNQIKESRELVKSKDDELNRLKSSVKVTRVQEIEVELKMFEDECTRLKNIIDSLEKQQTEKYSEKDVAAYNAKISQLSLFLNKLKQENKEIEKIDQEKKEEIMNWKTVYEKKQKKINEQKIEIKENSDVRKIMNDRRKEAQKYKDQFVSLKNSNKNKEIDSYKAKVDELIRRQADINDNIKQKDRKIEVLRERVSQAPAREQERQMELMNLRKRSKECILIIIYRRMGT